MKKLWAEGLSAAQVAERLGGECTRNMVISKIHRMGLPKREVSQRQQQARHGRAQARASKAKRLAAEKAKRVDGGGTRPVVKPEPFKPREPIVVPEGERKTLLQLENSDCRYPYGDGPFLFCGRKKMIGVSYCRDHQELCTSAPTVKGQRAASLVPVAAGGVYDQGGGGSSGANDNVSPAQTSKDLEKENA